MTKRTRYVAVHTDCGCLIGCGHKHNSIAKAAKCISVAGSYIVAVQGKQYRALTDAEEAEFLWRTGQTVRLLRDVRPARLKNPPWCPPGYLEEAQRFLEMEYSNALPIMRVPCGLTADLEYHIDTGRKVVTLLNPQMLTQHPLPLQAHILRERAFEQCGYKVEIRGTSIQ